MGELRNLKIFQRLERGETIRMEAFGASNTQRYLPGMHWFDYVELGFKKQFGGGCGQFINAGIGGNTTVDLLDRFDRDLAMYQPHAVILTIGGNDCNPDLNISPEMFRKNLFELERRITALGAELVFQTYYACDLENMDSVRGPLMVEYMQVVREVAAATSRPLVDHYARWEKLRLADVVLYRLLMLNAMHVNAAGNMVIGLDLMRRFELPLLADYRPQCTVGLLGQALLDRL